MRLECRADKLGTLPTIRRRTLSQTSQAIEKSVPIWSKMHTTIRPQVESLQPYGMIQRSPLGQVEERITYPRTPEISDDAVPVR